MPIPESANARFRKASEVQEQNAEQGVDSMQDYTEWNGAVFLGKMPVIQVNIKRTGGVLHVLA